MRFFTLLAGAFLITMTLLPGRGYCETSSEPLIQDIERVFQNMTTMTARFTQSFESKGFGQTAVHTGRLFVKKPSMMLWSYDEPTGKYTLADGKRLWLYEPSENVVYFDELARYLERNAFALFLTGKKLMTTIFDVKLVPESDKSLNRVRLKLVPKEPQAGVKAMLLTVNASDHVILSLVTVDYIGNKNRIDFNNIERNVDLDDSVFAFTRTEGVTVRKTPGT